MPRTDIDAVISSCAVRCLHLANRKKGSGYWLLPRWASLRPIVSTQLLVGEVGYLSAQAHPTSLVCVGHSADPVGSWTTLPTALSMCCNCVTNSDVSLR